MDYFKILNLSREPFSNSPDPDFFYQSSQHLGCLQKLELAVRLRRGLNVVMGNVGMGKTTLCRELLIRFAKSQEDRNELETHLLLDPAIGTPREFLAAVAGAFRIAGAATAESEWQLKEGIKQHLFQKGVDEGKTVVLIVDEGQKLPDFGLEILREFLNYETNEAKLLQIIIFAQNEFELLLRAHPNFADRVNQFITLKPLNFRETRQMIAFRIAQAAGGKPPRLFTLPGPSLAVYKATGGYPRRVITLCHQIMLTLIIQNSKRAGWFMVRSCAERVSTGETAERRPFLAPASSLAVLLLLGAGLILGFLDWRFPAFWKTAFSGAAAVATVEKEPAPAVAAPAAAALPKPAPPPPMMNAAKPEVLGRMVIEKGETVYGMLHRIYGDYDEEQLRAFLKANHRLVNINRIRRGDIVTLPAVPTRTNPLSPEHSWVILMARQSLAEAYEALLQQPVEAEGGIRLFPYWAPRQGMVFTLMVRKGFPDEQSAGAFIRRLPPDIASGARVLARWPEGTEFYAR